MAINNYYLFVPTMFGSSQLRVIQHGTKFYFLFWLIERFINRIEYKLTKTSLSVSRISWFLLYYPKSHQLSRLFVTAFCNLYVHTFIFARDFKVSLSMPV